MVYIWGKLDNFSILNRIKEDDVHLKNKSKLLNASFGAIYDWELQEDEIETASNGFREKGYKS